MGQISSQDAADFFGNPPEPDTPEPTLEELKATSAALERALYAKDPEAAQTYGITPETLRAHPDAAAHEFFTAGDSPEPDWKPLGGSPDESLEKMLASNSPGVTAGQRVWLPSEPSTEEKRRSAEFHARHTFSQIDPTIFHG